MFWFHWDGPLVLGRVPVRYLYNPEEQSDCRVQQRLGLSRYLEMHVQKLSETMEITCGKNRLFRLLRLGKTFANSVPFQTNLYFVSIPDMLNLVQWQIQVEIVKF